MPTIWMIKSILFHAVFFFFFYWLILVMQVVTVLQCSDTPYPHAPLSPSLISFMVSVAKVSVTTHAILSVRINLPGGHGRRY